MACEIAAVRLAVEFQHRLAEAHDLGLQGSVPLRCLAVGAMIVISCASAWTFAAQHVILSGCPGCRRVGRLRASGPVSVIDI